jgi:hypothetical protein
MTRFVSTSMALICLLVLLGAISFIGCGGPQTNVNVNTNAAFTTPAAVNCNVGTTTDPQIVKAIYDAIGASAYSKEVDQFNITASKPDVKIIGWSTNKTQIVALAQGAATGCNIKDSDFANSKPTLGANYQQRIGCPPGHGPCGDICIPEGEPCRVTNGPAQPPSWTCVPAASPTPSPGGSPAPTTKQANKH